MNEYIVKKGEEEKKRRKNDTIWDHLKNTPFTDDEFRFIL